MIENFKVEKKELYEAVLMYVSSVASGLSYKDALQKVAEISPKKVLLYFATVGITDLSLRWKGLMFNEY